VESNASISPPQIFYGSNPAADKLRKLKAKVDMTTDVMLGNIGMMLLH